jgi:hypothetical protein
MQYFQTKLVSGAHVEGFRLHLSSLDKSVQRFHMNC